MLYDTPDIVCDDAFGSFEAQSACYTLGYTNGGSFESAYDMYDQWSEQEIPFLMDDVQCQSASTLFLSCSRTVYYSYYYSYEYNGETYQYGGEDCIHSENVLLTCFESGNCKSYSFIVSQ